MDRFKIDRDHLVDAIDQMKQFDTELEAKLGELDRQIDGLHTTWTGQAADAQRADHDRWTRGATELRDGLNKLRDAAAKAHGHYDEAVETNTRMWP